jgi:serine/threonine protein kinase
VPAPATGLPFSKLGEYEVIAPIAGGGMATVWLGLAPPPAGHLVALKVVRAEHARNREFVSMFMDETRIVSRLAHPNIVTIYDVGHDGAQHYLAMELLRGHTLLELWDAARASGTVLPRPVVAWIGARVADALHHAHELRDDGGGEQHVVHRDVNPVNIFLTRGGVPKLIDFGLAKARDRITATAIGVVKGKLAYMAPEQAQGHPIDRRSDIFALGITLWELSLNRRLFREDSDVETIRRVQQAQVPDPVTLDAGYPRPLAAAIGKALARDPGERWQTALELRDALDAFVGTTEGIGAHSVRSLITDLFKDEPPADWELLAEKAASHPERLQVWDDERQKMTWVHASVEGEVDSAPDAARAHASADARLARPESLDHAIGERISALGDGDPLAAGRAWLERALVAEWLGDHTKTVEHAKASLAAMPTAPAHEMLRRLLHARGSERELIGHLDAEIEQCTSSEVRADLLAERARLLEAAGAPAGELREAWERALSSSPAHPASLKGLEGALEADGTAGEALARHLGRMAESCADEPRLAAWLHVDRARLHDRRLGQADAARRALEQALAVDGAIGPVRAACVAHAVQHDDAEWLRTLLADEARLESDPGRAAMLEGEAAALLRYRLEDLPGATGLIESAAGRAPVAAAVRRGVLDDLVALHEEAGHAAKAREARIQRLPLIREPREVAHELCVLAALAEASGERAAAVAHLERALEVAPGNPTLVEDLDRLLETEGHAARRVTLWARHAAATSDSTERALRLVRSARLATSAGDVPGAIEQLRAALVAEPGNEEATDRLLLLLAQPPSEAARGAIEARIAAHAHAARNGGDAARRIAHFEAIALLEEESLGDAARASRTYGEILHVEPSRRAAFVGLARTAARAGDAATLARALLLEADATEEGAFADSLRVRAAEALSTAQPERALGLVRDVLARVPSHARARSVEQRLHEVAERWAQVDASLASRVDHATDPAARVELLLARARLQDARLGSPREAIASLRAALAVDPHHPAARTLLVDRLASLGEARALLDGLVGLAAATAQAEDRARLLFTAAQIAELALQDDAAAGDLYRQAQEHDPGDPRVERCRVRVARRCAGGPGPRELLRLLAARVASAPGDAAAAFEHAAALIDEGSDVEGARALVDRVLVAQPTAPHALRALEHLARSTGAAPLLANALAQQAEAFTGPTAKVGALWAEAALAEWKLPAGDTLSIAEGILRHAPRDRAALDAVLRQTVASARAGDASARSLAMSALRTRIAQSSGDAERLVLHLSLGLLLDGGESPSGGPEGREALDAYREALRIDGRSVVAAMGAARLAAVLGDAEAGVTAALANAELARSDPGRRAALLVQAAGLLISTSDPRLGDRPERLARAGDMLEAALDAAPESVPAMGLLIAVRSEDGGRERLLASLRAAFDRARTDGAIVRIGAEVARVAATEPPDRVLAIDILRRVLAAVPGHGQTLRALADQCLAQGALGEGVEALEALAKTAGDTKVRLDTLFRLAEIYEGGLSRPADAERVLLAALDVDPANIGALERLLARARAGGAPPERVASWLERIADLQGTPEPKAAALEELATIRLASGDTAAAERALVEAVAQAPTPARVQRLLGLHPHALEERTRALFAAVARSKKLGRPDAACLAELGRLEGALGRWAEAVADLRVAVGLDASLLDARAALAEGLLHVGAAAEATASLGAMISPTSEPLLALRDPAAALASLERALSAEGRLEEGIVARELRVVAGGLDDGAHVELRARRLHLDPAAPIPTVLDASTIRTALLPAGPAPLLFELASAIAGADGKLTGVDLDDVGVGPRDRLPPGGGDPLGSTVERLSSLLGIPRPEVAVSDGVHWPRVVMRDAGWVVVPSALPSWAEPVQAAALAGPLVRIALALPWLDDLPSAYAHAVLCSAARTVVPGFASEITEADQQELIEEMGRRVAKALGRKQKKALAALADRLGNARAPTLADASSFERSVAQAELRAGFVLTGDLLATLDVVRARDEHLARATATVGPQALRATLSHPLAGDVARFALAPSTLNLRWRAGTFWGGVGEAAGA